MYSLKSTLFFSTASIWKSVSYFPVCDCCEVYKTFFFNPLTKNTERNYWMKTWAPYQTSIHQLNCVHTPFLAAKGNRNVFNVNPFLFQDMLNPINSDVLKSMFVCVDKHHSSADAEELEKPQEIDGESNPAMKCFGWILKTQRHLSKWNRRNHLLINLY